MMFASISYICYEVPHPSLLLSSYAPTRREELPLDVVAIDRQGKTRTAAATRRVRLEGPLMEL